jgi:hypothetical protein
MILKIHFQTRKYMSFPKKFETEKKSFILQMCTSEALVGGKSWGLVKVIMIHGRKDKEMGLIWTRENMLHYSNY